MKELLKLNLKDLVFIDIETTRLVKELEIDTPLFDSWAYKSKKETNEEVIESFKDRAALYPEFARVVCISVGRVKGDKLSMKTYNNEDEVELLKEFVSDLTVLTDVNPKTRFCGHAAIGFDIPFIFKRCMVNQVKPHDLIDLSGLKPWQVDVIDTKEIWRATSYEPTSLINIAVALGIPSPKDDISGAQVGEVYWSTEVNRIARISAYCEKDVLTTANVVRRLRFEGMLTPLQNEAEDVNETPPLIKHLFDGGKYTPQHKKDLTTFLQGLSVDERERQFVILNALISSAKGKVTKFKKTDLKELIEVCKEK